MPLLETLQKLGEPLLPGLLGMRIVEAGVDRIVAELEVRPELCTTGGILHGGAYMALADTLGALGTLMNMTEERRTATTDSSTKFIGAARVHTTIIGECLPLHRGRTTMVWQTVIRSAEGRICAVVTQTQLVLDA